MRSWSPLSGSHARTYGLRDMKSPPLGRGAKARWGGCALGNDYEKALAIHVTNIWAAGSAIRKPLTGRHLRRDAREVLVDLLDHDRALAHGRSHPPHRARADVTHHEDARDTRLEHERGAFEPPLGGGGVGGQGRPREDVPQLVASDLVRKPSRVRLRTDEHEERVRV